MWTILSSRVNRCAVLAVALLSVTAAKADPPRPALVRKIEPARTVDNSALSRSVELRSATLIPLDEALRQLVGEAFLKTASAPLAVDVRTVEPLNPAARTSWPVVVLNGQPIEHTQMDPKEANRLVAFLPDRSRVRPRMRVEVYWVGNEALTRTREPIAVRVAEPIN